MAGLITLLREIRRAVTRVSRNNRLVPCAGPFNDTTDTFSMKTRTFRSVTLAVLVGVLGDAACSTETGWRYERFEDAFDDIVTHVAYKHRQNEGAVSISCSSKTLKVAFSSDQYYSSVQIASVKVRIDKKPKQTFNGYMRKDLAILSEDLADVITQGPSRKKIVHFLLDLMQGTKLVFQTETDLGFQTESSDVVTLSLAGSAEPIGKVLKACNVRLD